MSISLSDASIKDEFRLVTTSEELVDSVERGRRDAVGRDREMDQAPDGVRRTCRGGPQTRRLLPHLGFQPCGEATGYVRTLRPQRLPEFLADALAAEASAGG